MPLTPDNWTLNTVKPTQLSLHLQDNQPGSPWEITSFAVDGGPDVKGDVSPLTDNHDGSGIADATLTLVGTAVLPTIPGATGTVSMDVYAADLAGDFFTESVNFSYTIPKLARIRLTASSGLSRIRLTHSGSL